MAYRMKKIFANHTLDKESISRIYNQLCRANTQTPKHLPSKWTKELNR